MDLGSKEIQSAGTIVFGEITRELIVRLLLCYSSRRIVRIMCNSLFILVTFLTGIFLIGNYSSQKIIV